VTDYSDLMTRFRRAYAAADPDQLGGVLTDDFVWHMHWFSADDPTPTGKVLHGIDEMVEQLQWRQANWTDVRFDGLLERFAPDLVTQTFRISGADRGTPFNVDVVDLYDVVDGRIQRKSTYWKQPGH
jgi:ketosteroid isomerase-like protein